MIGFLTFTCILCAIDGSDNQFRRQLLYNSDKKFVEFKNQLNSRSDLRIHKRDVRTGKTTIHPKWEYTIFNPYKPPKVNWNAFLTTESIDTTTQQLMTTQESMTTEDPKTSLSSGSEITILLLILCLLLSFI